MGPVSSRFYSLRREWRLLLETLAILGVVRLGLWALPFRDLSWLLVRGRQLCLRRLAHAEAVDRIVYMVQRMSRYVPRATCLTQALTTQWLMGRRGYVCEVHVGVARAEGGRLQAHAWVEYKGEIIIGGEQSSVHYKPLLAIKGNGS